LDFLGSRLFFVAITFGRGRGRGLLSSARFIVPSSSFVAPFEVRFTVALSPFATPFCLTMKQEKIQQQISLPAVLQTDVAHYDARIAR
jgi:hypothetical protein